MAACARCGRAAGDDEIAPARVVERTAVPRASLDGPAEAGLLYRTRRHAYHQRTLALCPECRAEDEAAETTRLGGLRRATMVLFIAAALLAVGGSALAVMEPDAGPDLLRLIWRDPSAATRPDPYRASSQGPYRAPFDNTQ